MFGAEKRRLKKEEKKRRKEEERLRKEAEERARFQKYVRWMLVIVGACLTSASAPSFSMILFAAITIMLVPIKQVDDLWSKLFTGKSSNLKLPVLVLVFVIACYFAPLDDTEKEIDSTAQTEIVSTEDSDLKDAKEDTETSDAEISVEKSTKAATGSEESAETVVAETESQEKTESTSSETKTTDAVAETGSTNFSLDSIPAYSGNAYVAVNDNVPFFTADELTTSAFEYYSNLDSLGRCGVAYANVCTEIMPTEERGSIGSVKPSGWHTVKYDIVNGKYLYNRCHLIGYQLSAENANTKNLITGTRYLNIEGMLPFENMVADYVKETNNHVLYRVTPMFDGNNLVASGVLMEAKSVEDNGAGILFNIYCYNVQPGISIDYATGDSSLDGTSTSEAQEQSADISSTNNVASSGSSNASTSTSSANNDSTNGSVTVHITNSGAKYHRAGCKYLKSDIEVTLDEAKAQGLSPCGVCNPPQ